MANFIEKLLAKHVKKTYPKLLTITPNNEMALYNYRCHLNAVEACNLGKAVGIIECVVMASDNDPITHFINIKEDGTYVDYSLGRLESKLPYHFVRTVDPSEFNNPTKMIKQAKLRIVDAVIPKWITRLGILPKYKLC